MELLSRARMVTILRQKEIEKCESVRGEKCHALVRTKPGPPPLLICHGEFERVKTEEREAEEVHRATEWSEWSSAKAEMESSFWATDWQFQVPSATVVNDGKMRLLVLHFLQQ